MPSEVFTGLPGVRDVVVEDTVLRCTIMGTPDALVKAAARYEVVRIKAHEVGLEEVF